MKMQGPRKWRVSTINKNNINGMYYFHATNSMKANDFKPMKIVIIEDVDEESKAEFEPLVSHSKDHHPSMILESSNRGKGNNVLTDDEIKENFTKQVSTLINNAYIHNPHWSQ